MASLDESAGRETVEQVFGHMIQRSIETGLMEKGEMIVMLEDMIQSVERGTLSVALDNA